MIISKVNTIAEQRRQQSLSFNSLVWDLIRIMFLVQRVLQSKVNIFAEVPIMGFYSL